MRWGAIVVAMPIAVATINGTIATTAIPMLAAIAVHTVVAVVSVVIAIVSVVTMALSLHCCRHQ
jgi:hypothetical protein